MKRWMIGCIGWLFFLPLQAQLRNAPGLGWQEASMQAAREDKLVFVAVGVVPEKEVFAQEEVRSFFLRHMIAIHIDMQTKAGAEFESRLLMTPYPVYAFFMPFGDLLVTVDPQKAKKEPLLLVEAAREALDKAALKKNNSRFIRFYTLTEKEAFEKAEKEEKLLFIYFRQERDRECLWMEKNVFNLDRVADFYNSHFIPWQPEAELERALAETYGVTDYPTGVFVNETGKVVLRVEGRQEVETFLKAGEEALRKAEGIHFWEGTWEEAKKEASERGKWIFGDCSVSGNRKRRLEMRKLYRDPQVAAFFNENFVNFSWKTDLPKEENKFLIPESGAFVFLDAGGNLVHRLCEVPENAESLLKEARRAIEGKGWIALEKEYDSGNREAAFLEKYIEVLGRAGQQEQAGEVAEEYLGNMEATGLKEKKYWELFRQYVRNPDSKVFQWMYAHREEMASLFGKGAVERKLEEVWAAGADRFVVEKNGNMVFEEDKLKEYAKRLKKEKVENRNSLIRNARMKAAEKMGDWKVYSNLAEERWNEEQIPEAELYRWGVKIQENCRDKSIRYKAARWFAIAVQELEQKERISGKIRPSSYKGFFEKLVDDLIKE